MPTWYEAHRRHFPERAYQVLSALGAVGGAMTLLELADRLNWNYNLITAWISHLRSQGLVYRRHRKYGITRKGLVRLRFLRDNYPGTGGDGG